MARNTSHVLGATMWIWVIAGGAGCAAEEPREEVGAGAAALGGDPDGGPPLDLPAPPEQPVGCCPEGGSWSYDAAEGEWFYECESGAELPAIWDLEEIRDPEGIVAEPPAGFSEEAKEGRGDVAWVQVKSVYFTSWEWVPNVLLPDGTYPNSWDVTPLATEIVRRPVRIHGHLAVPRGPIHDARDDLPAVVIGHGLPGQAARQQAVRYARNLGMVALAIDGPGQGQSTGDGVCSQDDDGTPGQCSTESDRCSLFRGAHVDPRASWLYGYAVAGMRAITYLGTLRRADFLTPPVDPMVFAPAEVEAIEEIAGEAREGLAGGAPAEGAGAEDAGLPGRLPLVGMTQVAVTGASGGGLMTMLVNGIDDRVGASVPLMSAGALDEAIESPGFEGLILAECGLDATSEAVRRLQRFLDPIRYAPASCAPTYLASGLQDEAFTVNAAEETVRALQASGQEVRWDIVPNWDHAVVYTWIAPLGLCGDAPFDNACEALKRMDGDFAFWMRNRLIGPPEFGTLPEPPVLDAAPVEGPVSRTGARRITFAATVDPGDENVGVAGVKLWVSEDRGCSTTTPSGYTMRPANRDGSRYTATVILSKPADELLYFVDVEYALPAPVIVNEPLDPTGNKCHTAQTAATIHLTSSPEYPGDNDAFRASSYVLEFGSGLLPTCSCVPSDAVSISGSAPIRPALPTTS